MRLLVERDMNTMLMSQDRTNTILDETGYRRLSIQQPWNTVWQRRKLSKRKLRQFFGRSAPVDVSPDDIEKYGLPALLQSNVPLCYFLYSLLEQYSSENLFFYLEVEQFQTHDFASKDELRKTALQLYRAFIKSNSDFEVNIDSAIRKPVRQAIDKYDATCFDCAKDHIQRLMEPCYMTFITSTIYQKMLTNLKGKAVPYDELTRETAINVLVEYLDRNMPVTNEHKTSMSKETQRRSNLIRAMIHAFCQTRLHLDFYDTEGGETVELTPEKVLPPQDSQSQNQETDMTRLIQMK
jgi:hypothetical protein